MIDWGNKTQPGGKKKQSWGQESAWSKHEEKDESQRGVTWLPVDDDDDDVEDDDEIVRRDDDDEFEDIEINRDAEIWSIHTLITPPRR